MKKFAVVPIIMAGILWGCMGLFVRKLNTLGLASMQIVQLRALAAAAVLFLVILLYDRRLFHIRWGDLWCFLGTGICSIVFFNYCYFKAMTITSLSVAAVLLYTAPIIVMVFSRILFQEKFTAKKVIALLMTFAGCALVTGITDQQAALPLSGILIGLGAGLGYALYSIFGRYALERGYQSLTITFYTFLIAFLGTLFLTDIRVVTPIAFADVPTFFLSAGLGVVCTVFPFLLYTLGLSGVENSKASIFASVEPVTATLLGVLVYREGMSLSETAGIILVIAALIVCGSASAADSQADKW